MKHSITKSYLYNLSYQILAVITPLITTPYLTRVLGADGIGTYSYSYSLVSYFMLLASLGVSIYAQREIAQVRDDKYLRSKVCFETIALQIILSSVSLILFFLFLTLLKIDSKLFFFQAINILSVTL